MKARLVSTTFSQVLQNAIANLKREVVSIDARVAVNEKNLLAAQRPVHKEEVGRFTVHFRPPGGSVSTSFLLADNERLIAEKDRILKVLAGAETSRHIFDQATPETPYKLHSGLAYLVRDEYKPKTDTFLWLVTERVYAVSGIGIPDDVQAKLVQKAYYDEVRAFERIRIETPLTRPEERRPIPESVRIEVWHRDDGKCVRCGSRNKLEYDHIIPVSLGGSNTARNIELLCETCNRAKGANVA